MSSPASTRTNAVVAMIARVRVPRMPSKRHRSATRALRILTEFAVSSPLWRHGRTHASGSVRARGYSGAVRVIQELKELLQLPDFRKLFAVRLVSQAGDGLFQVGLATLFFFSPESATPVAVLALSGEKKQRVASPTWNRPSPAWLTRRTAKSLRKSGSWSSSFSSWITRTAPL